MAADEVDEEAAVYQRGYNDAIDDIEREIAEGNTIEEILEWIKGLRKK